MGDRGNIYVTQPKDGVFLYSHWGGSQLALTLQVALRRKQRWDDPSYLARIIFCEMIDGDVTGETGFGISTSPPDNEHPILVVDVERQIVGAASIAGVTRRPLLREVPFAVYIELTPAELYKLHGGEDED